MELLNQLLQFTVGYIVDLFTGAVMNGFMSLFGTGA